MSQDTPPVDEKTVVAYVHAVQMYGDGSEYTFMAFGHDASSSGYIPIAKVEIPVPRITIDEIKARHIVLLRLKREEVYKEAAQKAAELDDQIARLECITYTPKPVAPADDPSIPF